MIKTNIKDDFPIFKNYPDLVYLDNAATTQKPRGVIEAVSNYYQKFNSNVHRGLYQLAEESTRIYEDSRKTVAAFIGADQEEIIFTRNTTEGLNLVAYSLGLNLKKGDEIILSLAEHHSNLVPWQIIAQKTGAVLKFIDLNEDGELDLNSSSDGQKGGLKGLLSVKTKIVSLAYISNVLGNINPLKEIFKTVKKFNSQIICIVDAAQSVAHLPLNVKSLQADFVAFSGHKMYGPMGIGVLYGKKEILEKMEPFLGGGDMIAAVYLNHSEYKQGAAKFEAGTPNVAGALGLGEAIRYLQAIGMENIEAKEKELTAYLWERLENFPNIKILGTKDLAKRSSLVAFEYKHVHAHDVGAILSSSNVAVRAGHHCAMPLHKNIGVQASTRISLSFYNMHKDIDQFFIGLQKVGKIFAF
ncbi:SufS family cysteine desulfurase [Candidatus Beckwithbacteria bacterium]|nr:SufS family cysteine desulfurase [Candidatus Beckwithbacteria bacterium]